MGEAEEKREQVRPWQKRLMKSEGRWAEYVQLREKKKGEGMDAADAAAKARDEMMADMRLKGQVVGSTLADIKVVRENSARHATKRVSSYEVIEWVFEHLGFPDTAECEAPSPGAWSYLQEIRKSAELKKAFYSLWAKVVGESDKGRGKGTADETLDAIMRGRKDRENGSEVLLQEIGTEIAGPEYSVPEATVGIGETEPVQGGGNKEDMQ